MALSYKEGVSNLTANIGRVTQSALDLLFPRHCLGCQREGRLLCPDCSAGLPRLEPPYCAVCAQPGSTGRLGRCRWCSETSQTIDGIRSPFMMEGVVQEAVHRLKYRGLRALAPELGVLLAQYLESHPLPAELIVPVPLHRRRLRSRGYNQAALLARELSKRSGLPVDNGLLLRGIDSPPQVAAADQEQRRSNVSGSFHCVGEVSGLAILLVDDVATTGSTLSACAAALKDAGAAQVWGLTLAREG